MNVIDAVKARFSVRKFLDKPVDKELVYKILDIARWSPSGHNLQPWEVAVVMGRKKDELSEKLIEAVKNKAERKYDYFYSPKVLPEHINARRKQCNTLVFEHKGIDPKNDKEALMEHILENFRFFGAPVALIIMREKELGEPSYIDLGIFGQTIMLTALEFGLATCAQTSVAAYPYVIRDALGIPENKMIVYAIVLGYPDMDAHINKLRMPRDEVEKFATFYE